MEPKKNYIAQELEMDELLSILVALQSHIMTGKEAMQMSAGCLVPMTKEERVQSRKMLRSAQSAQNKVIDIMGRMGADVASIRASFEFLK